MTLGRVGAIDYLKSGNSLQRECFEVLDSIAIMDRLEEYSPILAGTIPIDINVEGSDLDIICRVHDFGAFCEKCRMEFGELEAFSIKSFDDCIVCNFFLMGYEIEIYGSEVDSKDSNGVRHMMVEARVLGILGEEFKKRVIQLKRDGIKTEPAFGELLKLEGDPYEGILELEGKEDHEIMNIWKSVES